MRDPESAPGKAPKMVSAGPPSGHALGLEETAKSAGRKKAKRVGFKRTKLAGMSGAKAKKMAAKGRKAEPDMLAMAWAGGGVLGNVALYRAEPLERIAMVRSGVPAVRAKAIIAGLNIPSGDAAQALNLPVSTLNRKTKEGQALARDEGERVLGLARLIGQAEAMVAESGDPTGFDARQWLASWLGEALPALGNARPLDLLDTMEGQGLVSETLSRIQSGAYG